MALRAYEQANELLTQALKQSSEPAQRITARLLLAECRIFDGSSRFALTEALRVVQNSQNADEVRVARVIKALALLNQKEPDRKQAATLIQQAGKLEAPWSGRAQVALALIGLYESGNVAAASKQLGNALKDVPPGSLYRSIVDKSTGKVLKTADARLQQGALADVLEMVWPMVSSQAVPKSDAVLKPVELSGGWLMNRQVTQQQQRVVQLLAAVGKVEFDRDGNQASLLGYWLAAEVLRQLPADHPLLQSESSTILSVLASISRPASDRRAGQVLSPADQVQRELLIRLAGEPATAAQQKQLAQQLLDQVTRYQSVGDLETGLAQFVTVDAEVKPPAFRLAGSLQQLPPGLGHQTLLNGLAGRFAEMGSRSFQDEATAVVKPANPSVNQFDQVALLLYGQIATVYPKTTAAKKAADVIVARYTGAQQWDQAVQAAGLFYARAGGDTGRWSSVRIRIAQATSIEDELLAARRALGQELAPLLKTTLDAALKILQDRPSKSNRQLAIQTADALVARYAVLSRPDLSEAIIATMLGEQEKPLLADWSTWTLASLLHQRAATALATVASQTDDVAKLALHALHKSELQLLNQLIDTHPRSEFASAAVQRVLRISSTYQSYLAFDTAQLILADFLKAQPKLAAAEGIEYRSVQVLLAKARAAFAARTDKTQAPGELSDEYTAAIDALVAFLKSHPTGDYSPAAENELFAVARTYGTAGAWPVARGVLVRFTAAIPNFRSPGHLKLLQAATYLGELQGNHGLDLLTPSPKPRPQTATDNKTILALRDKETGSRKLGDDKADSGGKEKGAGESTKPDGRPRPAVKLPGADRKDAFAYGDAVRPLAPSGKPSQTALAMIRQSQQQQFKRLAMLEDDLKKRGDGDPNDVGAGLAIALPSGVLLSQAELKRQDDAADRAYAILIELVKSKAPADAVVAQQARSEMKWLFGFFEDQLCADRAIVFIKRYLGAHPPRLFLATLPKGW